MVEQRKKKAGKNGTHWITFVAVWSRIYSPALVSVCAGLWLQETRSQPGNECTVWGSISRGKAAEIWSPRTPHPHPMCMRWQNVDEYPQSSMTASSSARILTELSSEVLEGNIALIRGFWLWAIMWYQPCFNKNMFDLQCHKKIQMQTKLLVPLR